MIIEFYPEEHCDECMEIIHSHIDCPVCGEENAETDMYCAPYEQDEFSCKCGAEFKKVREGQYWEDVWERIE